MLADRRSQRAQDCRQQATCTERTAGLVEARSCEAPSCAIAFKRSHHSVVTKTWWTRWEVRAVASIRRQQTAAYCGKCKRRNIRQPGQFCNCISGSSTGACIRGTFQGKAGRAHARAISGTLSSPTPSLARGSTCSSPAVSRQSSEGSPVNDWFGSTAREDVHAGSWRRRVSLTAASNPIHSRRFGKSPLQALPRDGQINDRVLSVKAQLDLPAPRPSAGNPFPRGLPVRRC